MGERKRTPLGILTVLLFISASSFQLLCASDDADDAVISLSLSLPSVVFNLCFGSVLFDFVRLISVELFVVWRVVQIFYESFDETFEGRWIVSQKDDYNGNR